MDTTHPRWIDTADVAKLVRADLKAAFPGVTFGVTINRYSMGSCVRVGWTDGPSHEDVAQVAGGYVGQTFDGRDDSTHQRYTTLASGEVVHCGNTSISFNRRTAEQVAESARFQADWNARKAARLALRGA